MAEGYFDPIPEGQAASEPLGLLGGIEGSTASRFLQYGGAKLIQALDMSGRFLSNEDRANMYSYPGMEQYADYLENIDSDYAFTAEASRLRRGIKYRQSLSNASLPTYLASLASGGAIDFGMLAAAGIVGPALAAGTAVESAVLGVLGRASVGKGIAGLSSTVAGGITEMSILSAPLGLGNYLSEPTMTVERAAAETALNAVIGGTVLGMVRNYMKPDNYSYLRDKVFSSEKKFTAYAEAVENSPGNGPNGPNYRAFASTGNDQFVKIGKVYQVLDKIGRNIFRTKSKYVSAPGFLSDSPSPTVVGLSASIAENPLYTSAEIQGKHLGKVWEVLTAQSTDKYKMIVSDIIKRYQPNSGLAKEAFDNEVGRAGSLDDKHSHPDVQKAMEEIRLHVMDPLVKELSLRGQLHPEIVNKKRRPLGAKSYINRIYDVEGMFTDPVRRQRLSDMLVKRYGLRRGTMKYENIMSTKSMLLGQSDTFASVRSFIRKRSVDISDEELDNAGVLIKNIRTLVNEYLQGWADVHEIDIFRGRRIFSSIVKYEEGVTEAWEPWQKNLWSDVVNSPHKDELIEDAKELWNSYSEAVEVQPMNTDAMFDFIEVAEAKFILEAEEKTKGLKFTLDKHSLFHEIDAEYRQLIAKTGNNVEVADTLNARKKEDIEQIAYLYSKIAGVKINPESNITDSNIIKFAGAVRSYIRLPTLGMSSFGIATEFASTVFHNGMMNFVDSLSIFNPSNFKNIKAEAEKIGIMIQPIAALLRREAGEQTALGWQGIINRAFSKWSGLDLMTKFNRNFRYAAVRRDILENLDRIISGKLSEIETGKFTKAGLTPEITQRIKDMLAKYTSELDGFTLTNSELWSDREAAETFEYGLNSLYRKMSLETSPSSVPSFMDPSTRIGAINSVIFMFTNFSLVLNTRILATSLQNADKNALMGLALSVGLAAMQKRLREIAANTPEKNMLTGEQLMFAAVVDAGALGWIGLGMERTGQLFGGRYGEVVSGRSRAIMGSDYIASFIGPAGGKISDSQVIIKALRYAAGEKVKWNYRDGNKVRRAMPFQNVLIFRHIFDQVFGTRRG